VPVVFVTAFGDHALAAFDAGAVDYVMKPVDRERLAQAVARVRDRMRHVTPASPDLSALPAQLAAQIKRPPRLLRGRPDKLPVSRHFQTLFKGQ
jgi:DNA-binding LytR/AlgR family response regulator